MILINVNSTTKTTAISVISTVMALRFIKYYEGDSGSMALGRRLKKVVHIMVILCRGHSSAVSTYDSSLAGRLEYSFYMFFRYIKPANAEHRENDGRKKRKRKWKDRGKIICIHIYRGQWRGSWWLCALSSLKFSPLSFCWPCWSYVD